MEGGASQTSEDTAGLAIGIIIEGALMTMDGKSTSLHLVQETDSDQNTVPNQKIQLIKRAAGLIVAHVV